jgi:hypothetical protein
VGGYDETDRRLDIIHDYELMAKLLRKYGELHNIPDVLLLYRIHPDQLTHGLQSFSEENVKLRDDIISRAGEPTVPPAPPSLINEYL